MKKALLLAGVLGVLSIPQVFAQEETTPVDVQPTMNCAKACPVVDNCIPPRQMHRGEHPQKQFEDKLNLTEEQKAQAKAIREKEAENLKPIFEKIKAQHDEEKAIMNKRLTFDERQEELAPVKKEIHKLRSEIFEIRKQSKKDFEAILTDKQMNELKKIKEDAKKNFRKHNRHNGFNHRPMPIPNCDNEYGCGRGPKPPIDRMF